MSNEVPHFQNVSVYHEGVRVAIELPGDTRYLTITEARDMHAALDKAIRAAWEVLEEVPAVVRPGPLPDNVKAKLGEHRGFEDIAGGEDYDAEATYG